MVIDGGAFFDLDVLIANPTASVERAMYSDALGQVWAAGTNALATRLP
jgi:hypothetical protein